MLSITPVRSANGAAGYFAADNYYAPGEAATSGEWFGAGAALLGLSGSVDKTTFEGLLKGTLPDGTQIGGAERHRAGIDLTFSLPKSWSLLALVGGDRNILDAYRAAVKDTLSWAEGHAAEARIGPKGRQKVVASDNLVVALFEHDTSRKQEPQAHIHAIIANMTSGTDDRWRALHNDKLWSLNTLFNAMTMASFRTKVEALGYAVGDRGKHGNFEAEGITRDAIMAFSTRRRQILDRVATMANKTPEAFAAATLMTRPKKAPVIDRGALYQAWRDSAASVGLDLSAIVQSARSGPPRSSLGRLTEGVKALHLRSRAIAIALSDRIGLVRSDPYLPSRWTAKTPSEIAASYAVASAVRHLEQREAAFKTTDIYKAALETGLPVQISEVEARVATLVRSGQLVAGKGDNQDMMTTGQSLEVERRIVAAVDAGRGAGRQFIAPERTGAALREVSAAETGIALNPGQQAAGILMLASIDRIIAVQGIAGAGKSSVLRPVARLIEHSGQQVLGLAVQNTLVQMLERETGIHSMTISRFLKSHAGLLGDASSAGALALAREKLSGTALLVDEASMVSNADQLKLVELANRLNVGRLAFIGDARQLGAIDAGKPFSVMQQAGAPTAHMSQNIRARGREIRAAAAAAQTGDIGAAMAALAPFTVEAPGRGAEEAAVQWLSLSAAERARTAIYAAGRRLRGEINHAVQQGLVERGQIGSGQVMLTILERVNLTNEELRYAWSYVPGMILEVSGRGKELRLPNGQAEIVTVEHSTGAVRIRAVDGREHVFRPDRLRPALEPGMQLYTQKRMALHERDRIRWTASDHQRGLINADRAQLLRVDHGSITIETSLGVKIELKMGDPMLQRLDLAYALNAHMAQGLTSDAGIAVMETRDVKLANQQTFLVTVTRLRDRLTLIVDRADRLQRQLSRNVGGKTSALETAGLIGDKPSVPGPDPSPDHATKSPREADRSLEIEPSRVRPYEIGI